MSDKKTKKAAPEERRRADVADSTQPSDDPLAKFIYRECGQSEQPSSIDVYPITRRGDKMERLFHYDIRPSENIGFESAAKISNDIVDECQLYADGIDKPHKFIVCIIDNRRGGLAHPVATRIMHCEPRIVRPAPRGGKIEDDDDTDEVSAKKIMLESVKLIHEHDRFERENEGKIVGDVLVLMKESLATREEMLISVLKENKALITEIREFSRQVAERRVEERAVEIEAENAREDRKDRQAARERDNLWSDVMKASMLEAVKVAGAVFPGLGQLFLAQMTGAEPPKPPQLPQPDAPAMPAAPQAPPQAPQGLPEEARLVGKFIEAVRARKVGDGTAEEKLFGKDDEAGNPVEPGVFTREQVAILAGVSSGNLKVEALDVLLPDSGDKNAITSGQMVKAMPYLTPEILKDVTHFLKLRKDARGKN